MTEYNAFRVELADKIAHVQINRPDKINAMNQDFWREIIEIFRWVDDTDEVRVVVLSGAVSGSSVRSAPRCWSAAAPTTSSSA